MTLLSVASPALRWAVAVALLCGPWWRGVGQSALPGTAQGVLVEMATHAGVIFTGQVVGIERADASGYVDVRFRVDTAVRGVGRLSGGGGYVLREWAGLWTGGAERYRVGQRYLMLLTARGASGMSAPVGGMDGAIPLVAGGAAALTGGTGGGPPDTALAAAEMQVDLRWLAARALRAAGSGSGARLPAVNAPVKAEAVRARTIVGPITEPVGLEPDPEPAPETGWVGAVAPLPSAETGSSGSTGGAGGVALSGVLALLAGGGGSHVGR